MKLLRVGDPGAEIPAQLDNQGYIRDLRALVKDIDGGIFDAAVLERLRNTDEKDLPIIPEPMRIAPCVSGVGKFICIGLNYADHAKESGMPMPEEPEVFTKAITAICGPNDEIVKPKGSAKLDWEVELGLIIGKRAQYVDAAGASDCIGGYCVVNDVSERAFQLEKGSQWDKGKGCDTFGPIGPWLVTADEVPDVRNLSLWLEVNGHRYQDGNTSTMIFDPFHIVSYLSQFMTLLPGDIITTGTPPGVGLGQNPPQYLNAGDVVRLGIEGLGVQQQTIVNYLGRDST